MIDAMTIKTELALFCKQPLSQVQDTTPIAALVADSFMLVELLLVLQENLSIQLSHENLVGVETVGELIAAINDLAPATV
jgi:acyl carrier protein